MFQVRIQLKINVNNANSKETSVYCIQSNHVRLLHIISKQK